MAVVADDPGEEASCAVGDALWACPDRFLDGEQRRDIGYAALARGARHAAARLLSHPGASPSAQACNQLAVLFEEHGDWDDSRH